jgi:hypothetical protein
VVENKRNEIQENNEALWKELIQQLKGNAFQDEITINDADIFESDEIENANV